MKKFLAGILAFGMVFEMGVLPVSMALEQEDTSMLEEILSQIEGEEDSFGVDEGEGENGSVPMTLIEPDSVIEGEEETLLEQSPFAYTEEMSEHTGDSNDVPTVLSYDNSNITLRGDASFSESENQYTLIKDNTYNRTGALWYNEPISGNFSLSFDYYSGSSENRLGGADGLVLAFYAQNITYSMIYGRTMGFDGCEGYGVEIDTYYNYELDEILTNHIALIDESVFTQLIGEELPESEDENWHHLRVVVYNSTCYAYVDGTLKFMYEGLEKTNGYIGLTAASGGGSNLMAVKNLSLETDISDPSVSDFIYEELPDGTLKIIGYNGSATDLVIPLTDEILNKEITVIGESAFQGNTSLKEVEISYKITTIKGNAFMDCTSLEQVTVQPHVDLYLFCNLSVISANAFYNCSNLVAILFPNSIIEWEKIDIDSGAIDSSVNVIFSVINNSKFEFGTESSRFNNSKKELGDLYYISDEYRDILISKQGWSIWDSKYRDKIIDFSGSENKGLCFGTTSIMALIKAKKIIPQYIDSSASTMFMIGETLTDDMTSLFSYYHLLQWLDEFREHDLDKNDYEKGTELISSLADPSNPSPVFIVFDLGTGEGHAVLAYGIDSTTDDDYYLIYIADPNFSDSPNVIKINKNDFSEVKYYITRKTAVNVTLRYSISDLAIFNSHLTPNGALDEVQNIREYTSLTTYANSNFIIETEEKQAIFENGVLSEGTLDVQGPYGEIGLSESSTTLVDYYFKSSDIVQIQYFDSDFTNKYTIVNFADTLTVSFVDSTANEITFDRNGEITFDKGDGSISIIGTAVENSNVPWEATYITSTATNLALIPNEKGFDITSTETLDNIEVVSHTDVFYSETMNVTTSDTELSITSRTDEINENVYAVVVSKDDEVLDEALISGAEDSTGGNTEDDSENSDPDDTTDTPNPDDTTATPDPDDTVGNTGSDDTSTDSSGDSDSSGNSNNSSSNSSTSTSTSTTTYTNTLPTSENGTVTMTPTNPKSGDTVTLEITPNDGYEVSEVFVKRTSTETEIEVTLNEDGTYSFT